MAIPPVCHRFLSKVVVLQRLYDSRRKKRKSRQLASKDLRVIVSASMRLTL